MLVDPVLVLWEAHYLCFGYDGGAGEEETDDDGRGYGDFEGGCEHASDEGSPARTRGIGEVSASNEFEENGTDPRRHKKREELGWNEDSQNRSENSTQAAPPGCSTPFRTPPCEGVIAEQRKNCERCHHADDAP